MKMNKGNEKTIVEPVFNDIDLEKSSPERESPPPPYQEIESSNVNNIYPTILNIPSRPMNEINIPPVNNDTIITTTIIHEKCRHKKCCKKELSKYSKNLLCKQCNTIVQSTLSYEKGSRFKKMLILFIVLSLICPIFIIFLLILLMSNWCSDITHHCPYCHSILRFNDKC
ncbi:LPS-induced tumor necrosis factor alpha factor domain-containing protein [Strongyloides ratti]|uniref:LPS-induced tumor necrosis factor alpha factor domain-containing protein n=1 Tax=Strongyloides ratti TaxID=34506 RepID=A0A090LIJ8_STRRB|nr:LPS-induced tumor necrosis factor alpha factor domain-containing protein [Strongyloides ratti]CEF69637.1 LPS-induced tumor necrosis factor alpha factor domain-containing protein [Strongyloides ratti]